MPYSISRADIRSDREDILRLWARNFRDVPRERYSWIYENNLSGPATCCLARDEDTNSAIGVSAVFPRRMSVNGKYFLAGIAGDFAVDKKYRGYGPAITLQKAALSCCATERVGFVYGFPSSQAEAVIRRAGYRILGDRLRMTRPLRSSYYLKRFPINPLITKIISKPLDLGLKYFSTELYGKFLRQCSFEVLSSFDGRFDVLWDKTSGRFPIIGERSSAYLNWRYTLSPHKTYSTFALTMKKTGDLLGYIIYYTSGNRVHLADLVCLDMGRAFDLLVSEFLILQSEEGADSVTLMYMGSRALVKKLKRFGFLIRDNEGKVVISLSQDVPFPHGLLDKENWYLLEGDSDI